jgi:hypothetical protein
MSLIWVSVVVEVDCWAVSKNEYRVTNNIIDIVYTQNMHDHLHEE